MKLIKTAARITKKHGERSATALAIVTLIVTAVADHYDKKDSAKDSTDSRQALWQAIKAQTARLDKLESRMAFNEGVSAAHGNPILTLSSASEWTSSNSLNSSKAATSPTRELKFPVLDYSPKKQ